MGAMGGLQSPVSSQQLNNRTQIKNLDDHMRNLGNITSSPMSVPLSPVRKTGAEQQIDRKFMELYEEAKQRKERLEKV